MRTPMAREKKKEQKWLSEKDSWSTPPTAAKSSSADTVSGAPSRFCPGSYSLSSRDFRQYMYTYIYMGAISRDDEPSFPFPLFYRPSSSIGQLWRRVQRLQTRWRGSQSAVQMKNATTPKASLQFRLGALLHSYLCSSARLSWYSCSIMASHMVWRSGARAKAKGKCIHGSAQA